MSRGRIIPHLAGALVLALAIYCGGFWLDQHLRTRRGPWEVEFSRTAEGEAALVIQQPNLGIVDVRVVFGGERGPKSTRTVRFDTPEKTVPWGRVKYEDLTYLPGVVTLEVFGHELELLPRTLYVNREAVPWKSGSDLVLSPEGRPDTLPEPMSGRGGAPFRTEPQR